MGAARRRGALALALLCGALASARAGGTRRCTGCATREPQRGRGRLLSARARAVPLPAAALFRSRVAPG
jgi:hypothetical protein